MPKAKQRKDKRFCRKYKGKQFMGKTDAEAKAKRDAYKKLVEAGQRADAGNILVAEYAAKWLEVYKSDNGLRTYNEHVREVNQLLSLLGDKRMIDVDATDIQQVYNLRAGRSASYINHLAQTVKGVFSAAVTDRIILHNPCSLAKPPKGPRGTHRNIEDWERELILASTHRFQPAVMAMLYAGLRKGEALALDVQRDVDFKAMTITVRGAIRHEGNEIIDTDPKTKAGLRTIPMVDILADTLRPIKGLVAKSADGQKMTESAFSRAWDGFLCSLEEMLNKDMKRWYGRRQGQGAEWLKSNPWQSVHLQTHDMRHSYCTMLYDADVPLKVAQKWMGHEDQAMTLRIYTHLTQEREAKAELKFRSAVNKKITSGMQNGMQTEKVELEIVAS